MKLSEFLTSNGLSDADFARSIGVDRSTVSRLRREIGQKPSSATLLAIAKATSGQVTANDFWLAERVQ